MSPEITEKTAELLADLPPYLADDENVQMVVDVFGREFRRIEDLALDMQSKFFPQNADDTYGQLSLWEEFLGLPVAPEGASVELRRAAILTGILGDQGSGTAWVDAISAMLRTRDWSHHESTSAPYTVVITIPYAMGSPTAAVVARMARKFTPAHIELIVTYDTAFIIGDSLADPDASVIGEDPL